MDNGAWEGPLGGPWMVHKDHPAWKIMSFNVNGGPRYSFLGQDGTVGIDFGWDLNDAEKSWDRREGGPGPDDLSDILKEHSTVKIIHGRNGIGKTTFLNMVEEVGDLLRHSVPSFERGIRLGRVTDKSVFNSSKNQSKNLFNRSFESIEIVLANDDPTGGIEIPDDFQADGDERLVKIKISKISFEDPNPDEFGPHGELILDYLNIPSFCYQLDDLICFNMLYIEAINKNCSGKFAVLTLEDDGEGNFVDSDRVKYLDVIEPEWLDGLETTDGGPPTWNLENIDDHLGQNGEEWLDYCLEERDEEWGWDTQLEQLRNLDIIKIQVDRKTVPVLGGIPTFIGKIGKMKRKDWLKQNDPLDENRGLLEMVWHWHSLMEEWRNEINNFEDVYGKRFVNYLALLTSVDNKPVDDKSLEYTVMWDQKNNWINDSDALTDKEKSSLRTYCKKDRYSTTDYTDDKYRAHTLTCYTFCLNAQLLDQQFHLLIETINENFEGKELMFARGPLGFMRPDGTTHSLPSSTRYPPKHFGEGGELPLWIDGAGSNKITHLSSGEANLLIIHFILTMYSDGRIVLIDEPENSMHPEWKIRFIDDLKKITSMRSTQAIVATHSPMILGNHLEDTIELELQQDEA